MSANKSALSTVVCEEVVPLESDDEPVVMMSARDDALAIGSEVWSMAVVKFSILGLAVDGIY